MESSPQFMPIKNVGWGYVLSWATFHGVHRLSILPITIMALLITKWQHPPWRSSHPYCSYFTPAP